MANIRNGNTWYVDATGSLGDDRDVLVAYITVTATASFGRVVLADQVTGSLKMDLRVATNGDTQLFDFSSKPIRFPNSISVATLTNAIVTLVITNQGG